MAILIKKLEFTMAGGKDGSLTPASTECSSLPFTQLELLEATHRGLHKFIPRHRDELEIEIGDPIYVQKEEEDFWCEGRLHLPNRRTNNDINWIDLDDSGS